MSEKNGEEMTGEEKSGEEEAARVDTQEEQNGQKSSPGQASAAKETQDAFKLPEKVAFKIPVFEIKSQRTVKKETEDEGKQTDVHTETKSADKPKLSSKSPAQQLIEKSVPLPYKEPKWSGLPNADYSFEVLKNGTIVDTIALIKPFTVIGRLDQCDIKMEHPSISRFHCIIQYRAETSEKAGQGFYAYDLGSTHGSFHNKHQMKPHTYYRIRVGHMLKFGGSTRTILLQGPDEDQEPEMEQTVTELKAAAAKRLEKLEKLETGELDEEKQDRRNEEALTGKNVKEESGGIDWGMGDDAVEEDEDEEGGGQNPFASLNEELYLDDPKKTLRGWFEREGFDLPNYETEDISQGNYRCKVELPIPGPAGGPLVAIVEHRGKKKEAVVQCALEACRLLDRQGVLRQSKHESHERKRKDWAENDYYDSDEDNFLDRTGDVEKKRMRRMKQGGSKDGTGAETYDSLIKKYNEVIDELSSLEEKLAEADRLKEAAEAEDEEDLDSYMKKLKTQVPDKHKRVSWKLRTIDLRKQELRFRRLTNVARPLGVPELQPYQSKYGDKKLASQKVTVGSLSRKQMLFMPPPTTKTVKKEPTFQPHKVFLEEEPERKIKLRRLDDDDDDDPPKPVVKPKKKPVKKYFVESTIPETSKQKVPTAVKEEVKPEPISEFTKPEPISEFTKPEPISEFTKPEPISEFTSERMRATEMNDEKQVIPTAEEGDEAEQSSQRDRKKPASPDSRGGSIAPEESGKAMEVPPEKKGRFHGPALPPTLEVVRASQQEKPRQKKKREKKVSRYDEDNPNYDTWMPPTHQTGDGRTSLNEKLGY